MSIALVFKGLTVCYVIQLFHGQGFARISRILVFTYSSRTQAKMLEFTYNFLGFLFNLSINL